MLEDPLDPHCQVIPQRALGRGEGSPNGASQEKFHRRILKGSRNVSDTLANSGMKFLLFWAKQGILDLLSGS